ncbi:hypothetical protein VR44_37435, partial [Streptomyces katrae]
TEAFPAFTEPSGPVGPSGPTGGPALGTVPVGAEETPRWPGPEALDSPAVPRPGPAAPPPGPRPPLPTPAPAGKSGKP